MNKKLISGLMIVLFALSLTIVACDNGTTGGGTDSGGGVSVAKEYRGVYKVRYDTEGWKLEVKEKTLEVQKGTTGAVKIIPVSSVGKKERYYFIGVPRLGEGMSGGDLTFWDDGSIQSNGEGKLQYYPGDDASGEEIPDMWIR